MIYLAYFLISTQNIHPAFLSTNYQSENSSTKLLSSFGSNLLQESEYSSQ